MVSIQQHLVMPMLADFIIDNDSITTLDELADYIRTLKLEPIKMLRGDDAGIVKAEAYRPYLIMNQDEGRMYWAVHIPTKIKKGWEKIHEAFISYGGNSLNRIAMGNLLNEGQSLKYPLESIPYLEYLNPQETNAIMLYYIMGGLAMNSRTLLEQNIDTYSLNFRSVCWGNLNTIDIYYMDEILELKGGFKNSTYLNWVSSPLEKCIIIHRENMRLERERIDLLERMEGIKKLTEKNKVYISRKQRKYLKNRLDVINDKVNGGLYFDYNRLSLLYEKVASIVIPSDGKCPSIHDTIAALYTSNQKKHHSSDPSYRKIFENIGELFPDYDIITKEQFNLNYPNTVGWETQQNKQFWSWAWFQELYMSGVDLSYYEITDEDLNKLKITVPIHENTICLNLSKEGGPLSKSIYYKAIEEGRMLKTLKNYTIYGQVIVFLPRWAFVDKRR